jgi:adenylyltransferase/sulfurtransferase
MSATDRYARHRVLTEIGAEGQERLASSAVLVVGCGALGSMLCQVMVRSGVGRVRVVDSDPPEMHNLHRQILYDEDDTTSSRPKAEIAAEKLRRMNREVEVEAVNGRATAANIEALVDGIDLVLDGSDNFHTRLLINDVCLKLGLPWVYGGVMATVGMTMNIIPNEGPCFRCFVAEAPPEAMTPTTETHGVLATVPLMLATVQATEGIKILLGKDEVRRELIMVDVWNNRLSRVDIQRVPDCPACVQGRYEFLAGEGNDG